VRVNNQIGFLGGRPAKAQLKQINQGLINSFPQTKKKKKKKNYYNIFFVQEPLWNFIYYASSTVSLEGDQVVGAPIYPN